MRRWLGSSLVVPLLVACGGDGSAERSAEFESWTASEELVIGSVDDPDYSLTFLRGLTVDDEGAIFTLHPQEQVVRKFDVEGNLVRLIGGRGDGPGEFQNAFGMGWVADTLWVLDGNGYRLSYFDPSGELARTHAVPFDLGEPDDDVPPARPDGLLADGTVHGSPPAFSDRVADGRMTHHVPVLMTPSGEVTDTLPAIRFGNNSWAISHPEGRGGMYTRQPFADGPLWRFVPGEEAMVVLDRTAPTSVEEAAFTISKLSFAGDTLFSRTYPFEPEPVREEEADSLIHAMAEMMSERGILGATLAQAETWAREGFFRPAFRPGVTSLMVDEDGGIWVGRNEELPGQRRWEAYDADGRPVAAFTLPTDVDVMHIRRPHVWGTRTDDLGVPYVVRFRLEEA